MSEQLKFKLQMFENHQVSSHEQLKVLQSLLNLIQEITDCEEKHQKSLDKICQSQSLSLNKLGYQKLFEIVIENIQTKQKLTIDYVFDMRQQIDIQKELIIKQQQTLKKYQEDFKKHDQFCLQNFSLIDKIKDKYYSTSKEFEEAIFQLGSNDKNLECPESVKQKLYTRIQTLNQQKHEFEQQYKVHIGQHSKATLNFESEIQQINTTFIQMEQQRMTSFQEFILKTEQSQQQLNNILSQQRAENIQQLKQSEFYPSENEIQDIQKQQPEKVYYTQQKQTLYQSYLTEHCNQILRENINKGLLNIQLSNFVCTLSADPLDNPYSEEMKQIMFKFNQSLFQQYEGQIPQEWSQILMIQQQLCQSSGPYQRKEQKQIPKTNEDENNIDLFQLEVSEIQSQQIENDEITQQDIQPTKNEQKPEEIKVNVDISMEKTQENIFTQHFNNNEIGENILFIIHNMIIYAHPCIKETVSLYVLDKFSIILRQQLYFEICVYMIQSFRTFKKENLTSQGFKNLADILSIILDSCHCKKDTRNARKLMLMTFTIYTIYPEKPDQKIFIQEQQQIRKHQIWLQIDLWESMIYDTIDEILSSIQNNSQNQNNFQQNSLIFSNILSIGQSMIKFKIQKNGLTNLLTKYAKYFGLFEIQIQEIHKMIDANPKNSNSTFMTGPSSVQILNTFYQQQVGGVKKDQQQAQVIKNTVTQSRKLDFNIIKK